MFIGLYAFAQIHLFNRGTGYRKVMSFRGGRKPDVGIRSPKCFDYMGIWYKTEGFKDTDCHGHKWPRNDIAYLIPDS